MWAYVHVSRRCVLWAHIKILFLMLGSRRRRSVKCGMAFWRIPGHCHLHVRTDVFQVPQKGTAAFFYNHVHPSNRHHIFESHVFSTPFSTLSSGDTFLNSFHPHPLCYYFSSKEMKSKNIHITAKTTTKRHPSHRSIFISIQDFQPFNQRRKDGPAPRHCTGHAHTSQRQTRRAGSND